MIMDIDFVGEMLEDKGLSHSEIDEWFAHHGVKGMKWGVRRDPTTGVRPIARTLDNSKFADRNRRNIEKHNARVSAKSSKSSAKAAAKASAPDANDRFGNRNNKKAQRKLDRYSRVASGTASRGDRAKAALLDLTPQEMLIEGGIKGAAAARLDRGQRLQNKINAGKKHTTDVLSRVGGYDIRELNYSYNG